tara:strand:- start:228 stop:509 length:282 start_codon:yes stop_codon:yes gene_type:complete
MVIDNQLNPDKYTEEQLDENAADAYVAYYAADAAAAAYACTSAAYAHATAYASDDTDAATYAAATVDYWLRRYFKQTGENKRDYIDAINKDNK